MLEAMAESQVSIDGNVKELHDPFFVIATQNPVDSRGTYPLPEAQMDRFAVQLSLGYLSPEAEIEIISQNLGQNYSQQLRPCLSVADITTLKQQVQQIRVSPEVKRYVVDLIGATRRAEGVQLGASPRGSIALVRVAQALALFDGYEFVLPDQIQEIAVAVLAHRLVMEPQARFSGRTAATVVAEILRATPAPA